MSSRTLLIAVLSALLVAGLALSLQAAWASGDWRGFRLNLGTELVGAVATYFLFDQFIERRERTESEKARLIAEMGSSVQDVAVAAVDKLRRRGWLKDGSLQGADLRGAKLQGAHLWGANLQGADLMYAKLQGTHLWDANLQGADLANAKFDETTMLPDNTKWTPDTDMARFTNPEHPEFWQPEWAGAREP